jgi:hypothetical protein
LLPNALPDPFHGFLTQIRMTIDDRLRSAAPDSSAAPRKSAKRCAIDRKRRSAKRFSKTSA